MIRESLQRARLPFLLLCLADVFLGYRLHRQDASFALGFALVAAGCLYAGGSILTSLFAPSRRPERPTTWLVAGFILFLLGLFAAGWNGKQSLATAALMAGLFVLFAVLFQRLGWMGAVLIAGFRWLDLHLGVAAAGGAGLAWAPGLAVAALAGFACWLELAARERVRRATLQLTGVLAAAVPVLVAVFLRQVRPLPFLGLGFLWIAAVVFRAQTLLAGHAIRTAGIWLHYTILLVQAGFLAASGQIISALVLVLAIPLVKLLEILLPPLP